jgi:hypothetical protein
MNRVTISRPASAMIGSPHDRVWFALKGSKGPGAWMWDAFKATP